MTPIIPHPMTSNPPPRLSRHPSSRPHPRNTHLSRWYCYPTAKILHPESVTSHYPPGWVGLASVHRGVVIHLEPIPFRLDRSHSKGRQPFRRWSYIRGLG